MGRVSPAHPYNAGRAGLGWGEGGLQVYAACSVCVGGLSEGDMDSLANHSMRIQGVYVGTVPIPQFIKKKSLCV